MLWLLFVVMFKQCTLITLNENCGVNQFYNNFIFECSSCSVNSSKNFAYNDDLKRCFCLKSTYYDYNTGTCRQCAANEEASRDGTKCMLCSETIPAGTNECSCGQNQALIETDLLGFKSEKKCVSTVIPTTSIYPENVCRGNKTLINDQCSCAADEEESQGICILKALIKQPKSIAITYNNIENMNTGILDKATTDSGLIDYFYPQAARDCYYKVSLESCQVLANLCVLRLYDEQSPECKLYNDINWNATLNPDFVDQVNNPGWKKNMPWLYYKTSQTTYPNATELIMNKNRIAFEVSFDPQITINVNKLQFYMAKFMINGTFVGFLEVNREFILCSKKFSDETDFRTFGNTIVNECQINLPNYLKRDYEMYFYEVFLKDDTNGNFIDVPVLIENIYNTIENKQNNSEAMRDNWILTRRFFLVDNLLSLKTYPEPAAASAEFITYAKSLKFVIQLTDEPNVAKIYVPYIQINFVSRKASDLTAYPSAPVAFISEYSMDITKFMNVCLGLVIAISVVALIAALAQMYTWVQMNPSDLYPKNYAIAFFIAFIFKLFRFFGFLIFWFTWIISAYWYIFFKLQFRVYVLLPPLNTYDLYYKKFDIVFGLGCASYCLYIFYRIYLQSTYSIYFIDWEQDKEMLEKSLEKRAMHSTYYRYKGAWRQLQVVNQFFELQKKRNISFYFCIIWVVLMYYRVDWWYKEIQVPLVVNVEHSPVNFILRHFVTSFIIIVCGATQFILIRLLQFWLPLKTVEFLDLCSVSNISVFILTDGLHGYYIHGKSPLGKADANLDELLRFLEREAKDRIRDRGITDGENSELQSFEMFISYAMRTVYDGLYCIQVDSSRLSQGKSIDAISATSQLAAIFKKLPAGVKPQSSLNYFSDYMNNQLKNKIETIILNPRMFVFDKLAYEADCLKKMVALFLGYPPSLMLKSPNSKDITLFKDPRNNFDEVLFSGIEFEWFIFEVYLFLMWMRVLNNMEIAFFLAFLCEKIASIIRNIFVERNIGKKAVVDTRFIS